MARSARLMDATELMERPREVFIRRSRALFQEAGGHQGLCTPRTNGKACRPPCPTDPNQPAYFDRHHHLHLHPHYQHHHHNYHEPHTVPPSTCHLIANDVYLLFCLSLVLSFCLFVFCPASPFIKNVKKTAILAQ